MSASVRWFRGPLVCLAAALVVCVCAGGTEVPALCPQPQQARGIPGESGIDVSKGYVLHVASGGSAPVENAAARLVSAIEKAHGATPGDADGVAVCVGVARAFRDAPPSVKPPDGLLAGAADLPTEGYVLCIAGGRAWVVGRDERGAVYGTETLMQLLKQGPQVAAMDIRDFPDTPFRMSYVNGGFEVNDKFKRIVRLAVHYKLNMLVLENHAYYQMDDPKVAAELRKVFDYCRRMGIEPIPELQSFGWAHFILPTDPICVEAAPWEDRPFTVGADGMAVPDEAPSDALEIGNADFEKAYVPPTVLEITNADFEKGEDNTVPGWRQDDVGKTVFLDGDGPTGTCLRITRKTPGMSIVRQTIGCRANTDYTLEADMKTEASEGFEAYFEVYGDDHRWFMPLGHIKRTTDWQRRRLVFNSRESKSLIVYLRIQSGVGTAWFDNVSCKPISGELNENRLADWRQDAPGKSTFVEERPARVGESPTGNKCLRITRETPGIARASQTIPCKPDSKYTLEVDMKTEAGERFEAYFEVYGDKGLFAALGHIRTTTDWQRRSLNFYTGESTALTIYLRIQEGVGTAWFDNVSCGPTQRLPKSMINVVRSTSLPVVVKSADAHTVYEENADYEILPGELQYPFESDAKPWGIRMKPGGRIKAGEAALVSYHWAVPGDITYCPSEPRTRAFMKKSIQNAIRLLKPRFVHIGHDEPRVINRDARCTVRNMKAYELFADDVRRIHGYAKEADAKVRLMMWADALRVRGQDGQVHIAFHSKETCTLADATANIAKDIIICRWEYGGDLSADVLYGKMTPLMEAGYQTTGSPWHNAANTYAWGKAVARLRSESPDKFPGMFLTTWGDRWDMLPFCADLMWTLSSPALEGSPEEIADQVKRLYADFETVK